MSLTRARVGNEVDKRRRRGVSPYVGQGFKKVLNMNANGWSRKGCKDVKVAKELKLKGSSLGRTVISGSTGYDELYKCRKRETVEKSHSSLLLLLLSIISPRNVLQQNFHRFEISAEIESKIYNIFPTPSSMIHFFYGSGFIRVSFLLRILVNTLSSLLFHSRDIFPRTIENFSKNLKVNFDF